VSEQGVLDLAQQAVWTVLMVGGPLLGISLVTGLTIGILQAITQINEQTLTFVPKIIAVFTGIVVFGPWMLTRLVDFAAELFRNLHTFVH
jgi:flagellar biosynthetic protein FliQ